MSILICPVCECPTQRRPNGTPLEGLRMHQETVHPDQLTVVRVTTSHYDAQGAPLA